MRLSPVRSRSLPPLAASALGLLVAAFPPAPAAACSPETISLHERFDRKARVFVGVAERALDDAGTWELRVEEAFKGFPLLPAGGVKLPVAFALRTQCGFDAPKPGDRFLVFLDEGERLSHAGGSMGIWRERDQAEAHLNPVLDQLVLLRRMLLFGSNPLVVVVPDAETAEHLAVQALLPVFGKALVSQNKPFRTRLLERKPSDEPVWEVVGTPRCEGKPADCPGPLTVELRKVSGEITRVAR